MNYLFVFILMVFNEFFVIGTTLYSILNSIFLVFLAYSSIEIICRLRSLREQAVRDGNPERAINVKISLMTKSMTVIIVFFILELFYHGVLGAMDIPSTRWEEQMFYISHETTDFILITILLFVLRTQDFIPYFGATLLKTFWF